MNDTSYEIKKTLLYIAIAFTFSVVMRLIWVYYFNDYAPFHYNGAFMINTNDGYYWAEGARDLLSGTATNPDTKEYFDRFHQFNDLSPVVSSPAQLTAVLVKILPFSFENIIFYMPVFLSSLVVIPIILISRLLKNLEMGIIAALLASISWSYYNRSMAGYYDADMLNIVLPMFLLWSIIEAVQTNRSIYLLITAIDILIYRWWYPQSYSLEFSFFSLILVYTGFFDRKNLFNYKLMAIMMVAMMNGNEFMRLGFVIALYIFFLSKKNDKYIYYILGIAIMAFLVSGGLSPIWSKLKSYVFIDTISQSEEGLRLHFYTVMQTVREAGHISFETFANRISGHTVTFFISFIGYIYLLYKERIMIFSLPLLGLGFLAYFGGLRFTIYAVPVLAFGIGYLITEIARIMPTKKLKYLSLTAFTLAVLFPNYKHIEAYKVPTVFNSDEVAVLESLGKKANREDYVIAWWDYGYPIRYYADVKTLVDGSKHHGDVNFPVSYILTHTQQVAAKMARLDVEYAEKNFVLKNAKKAGKLDKNLTVFSNIEQMTKDYGFDDTNQFLQVLKSNIVLPLKTRDIYFYLPLRMLSIYPTVELFSNINLMNGEKGRPSFFYVSRDFQDRGSHLKLGNDILLDKRTLELTIRNKKLPIRRFVTTEYKKSMKLHKDIKLLDFSSDISIIYMKNYNIMLLVDEKTYNSLYIQLMVLENYDKKYFEPVILEPNVKVYKLKI